jgi:hypothetical protein
MATLFGFEGIESRPMKLNDYSIGTALPTDFPWVSPDELDGK